MNSDYNIKVRIHTNLRRKKMRKDNNMDNTVATILCFMERMYSNV